MGWRLGAAAGAALVVLGLAGCRTAPLAPRRLLQKPGIPAVSGVPTPGAVYRGDVALPERPSPRAWEVGAVGGVATLAGSGTGSDAEPYAGFDVARPLTRSLAVVGTWRIHGASLDRAAGASSGPPSTGGPAAPSATQDGRIHHLAALLSWETPPRPRRAAIRLAAGPELFATDGFDHDDAGLGGMAEAGAVLSLGDRAALRLGATVHGMPTDAGGTGDRWLWAIAGTVSVQVDL
jgi:hypothetical protein